MFLSMIFQIKHKDFNCIEYSIKEFILKYNYLLLFHDEPAIVILIDYDINLSSIYNLMYLILNFHTINNKYKL